MSGRAKLKQSLDKLSIPALRRPKVLKLEQIRLDQGDEDSPFSATEQMAYQNIFPTNSTDYKQLKDHKQMVFDQLRARPVIEGAGQPPFPDISPGARKVAKCTGIFRNHDLVLLLKYTQSQHAPLMAKYRQRKVAKKGAFNAFSPEMVRAAWWAVDKLDPLDYWRTNAWTTSMARLPSVKSLAVAGVPNNMVSGETVDQLLANPDELQPVMAIFSPNLINESELEQVLDAVEHPWKEYDNVGGVLAALTRRGLMKSGIGPGKRLYLTSTTP